MATRETYDNEGNLIRTEEITEGNFQPEKTAAEKLLDLLVAKGIIKESDLKGL